MKSKLLYTILILFITLPSVTHADSSARSFKTGNMLLNECEDGSGDLNFRLCVGYLTAVSDMAEYNKAMLPDAMSEYYIHTDVCEPADVSIRQLQEAWILWAKAHSEDLHAAAAGLVQAAFAQAFPCD